jgi:hypothetical protein
MQHCLSKNYPCTSVFSLPSCLCHPSDWSPAIMYSRLRARRSVLQPSPEGRGIYLPLGALRLPGRSIPPSRSFTSLHTHLQVSAVSFSSPSRPTHHDVAHHPPELQRCKCCLAPFSCSCLRPSSASPTAENGILPSTAQLPATSHTIPLLVKYGFYPPITLKTPTREVLSYVFAPPENARSAPLSFQKPPSPFL